MREIKFRAWKQGFPWMMQVLSLELEPKGSEREGNVLLLDHPCPITALIKKRFHKEKFKSIIIMEYTGLKDKKGKEIYEGDIVKCGNYLNIVNWSKQYGLDNYFFYENEDKEVVGNIYENPKLLTKEQI